MSTARRSVDVAILGGGAAGLGAARMARYRGASVVLVNDGPLGGDCTFTGCVPSKSVIEAAADGASFTEAFARARTVIDRIASTETADVLRSEGVDVIEAEGTLVGPGRLDAAGIDVSAKGVVLALGSRPAVPPIPGIELVDPLTSENVWQLTSAPASMVVVGGGSIGCELGQALARLGVRVTIVELADRLLLTAEPAAAAAVERALIADGVDVRTGVGVERFECGPSGAAVAVLSDGSTVATERVLLAVGRQPNSDRGGLAAAGIELDRRGHVVAGDDMATSVDKVYAAGDVTGKLQLTHAADKMGRVAASNIVHRWWTTRFRPEQIPAVTFTDPEVATLGLSEAEAAVAVPGALVAELPLVEHDRALTAAATDGYIKLIAGPNPVIGHRGGGRLIGATIVAERAGEMIAELAMALRLRTFVGQLVLTVHPYPTWSYAIPKAAAQFFTSMDGRTARPAQ